MKQYTEKDLVSFGNYLLSKERKQRIKVNKTDIKLAPPSLRATEVQDADLANWQDSR
jgi:hypothetical protein